MILGPPAVVDLQLFGCLRVFSGEVEQERKFVWSQARTMFLMVI